MDGQDHMQPTSTTKLTYDDYMSFPDDGQRHELIDGEHYVTPSPVIKHQRVSRRLLVALALHLDKNPVGEVFYAPLTVALSRHDVVEPDLFVVLGDQADILTEKHVWGAPAIVAEVLSPSTRRRDFGIKGQLYERAGVCEYWLIDPERDVLTIRRRVASGRLQDMCTITSADGEILTTTLLPGFTLSLADLFR